MKYINKNTGVIWENDDVEAVLRLIKNKPHLALYEEPKQEPVEEGKIEGITAYIPKPKSKKINNK